MASTSHYLQLKIKTDSKFFEFLEWYETEFTSINPDTGRKRRGNVKKFLIDEIDTALVTGKMSSDFNKVLDDFKKSAVLSPELQIAKKNLSDSDFAKFMELMEKAKSGAVPTT